MSILEKRHLSPAQDRSWKIQDRRQDIQRCHSSFAAVSISIRIHLISVFAGFNATCQRDRLDLDTTNWRSKTTQRALSAAPFHKNSFNHCH
ncbi:MAG: hypothetical protein ACLP2Y_16415 [Limisphaerales bacterium]